MHMTKHSSPIDWPRLLLLAGLIVLLIAVLA